MKHWHEQIEDITTRAIASRVIIFGGDVYPYLFVSWFIRLLKHNNILTRSVDVTSDSMQQVRREVTSSFLGSTYHYWLRGVHELSASALKEFLPFIAAYQGPHTILLFLPRERIKEWGSSVTLIDIPDKLAQQDCIQLLRLYDKAFLDRPRAMALVERLFPAHGSWTIEQALLLMSYMPVVGKLADTFIQEWVPRLISPELSLFALSQAFFAKDKVRCLQLWEQLKGEYSEQFWTAYWSEQLWRAYFVLQALQCSEGVRAKQLSARLPFSFLQRDWKRWSLVELQRAHDLITTIELALKQGSFTLHLDRFYLQSLS